MDWASGRKDTLVIVVADHETGGLKVAHGKGKGQLPAMEWTAGGHTSATVPIFAWGVGAQRVHGTLDNTDLYRLMMGTFRASSTRPSAGARASASARREQPACRSGRLNSRSSRHSDETVRDQMGICWRALLQCLLSSTSTRTAHTRVMVP